MTIYDILENRVDQFKLARGNAFNIGLAYFCYCAAFAIAIAVLYLSLGNKWLLFLLSFPFGLFMYASHLITYTEELMELLWEYKTVMQNSTKEKAEDNPLEDRTIINFGKRNYVIHVYMRKHQLLEIAKAALATNTLTVNFIESLGFSRANAEKIRVEFSNTGFLTFDAKGRVALTQEGKNVFQYIEKTY